MESEQKKAIMLLKSLIFHYHGLDDEEKKLLTLAAKKYDASEELTWANEFIAEDYMSAFERSKEFLGKVMGKLDNDYKLAQLKEIWEENHHKGYVTEMETTAMINLSKDWNIEREFIQVIKN